jgi:hypothetical protein
MIALLSRFLHISGNDTPLQLPHHSQSSREFSPSQNRRLFCEAFEVRDVGLDPARKIDWDKIEDEVLQSRIEGMIKPNGYRATSSPFHVYPRPRPSKT